MLELKKKHAYEELTSNTTTGLGKEPISSNWIRQVSIARVSGLVYLLLGSGMRAATSSFQRAWILRA